jgi:hypothetical protein
MALNGCSHRGAHLPHRGGRMPKKKRSSGKGNVVPITTSEHFRWKCPLKKCNAGGTVYTKSDVKGAIAIHVALIHPDGK